MNSTATDGNPLALHGGTPTRTAPWPARHLFGQAEKDAAIALFDESIATGNAFGYNGAEEQAYCTAFAEQMGGGFADGVNSGSTAVYVALRALNIEPFTEVIVPPVSDPGGFMPVPLMNCIPVPADAAPGSYNTSAEQIEKRITPHTRAIVVAHIAGHPVDMDPIMELARAKGIPVMEDCAQAHGARYKGRALGSIGDIAAFSTMFGKHHATGGQGGVVFTRNRDLYWSARRCADRGKPFGLEHATSNVTASLNYNLNELSAAIGRVQLGKLPGIVEARRQLALKLADACRSTQSVRLTTGLPDSQSSFWFLLFQLDTSRLTIDKDTFVKALHAEGIPANATYAHTMIKAQWYKDRSVFGTAGLPWTCPLYKGDPNRTYDLPNLHAADEQHFNILFHERWTDQELHDIVNAILAIERAYLKQ